MLRKIYIVSAVTLCMIISVAIVANAFGIDVIELALQRMNMIALRESSTASTKLEDEKDTIINSLIEYIQQYKTDLDQSLSDYSNAQTQSAKNELKDEADAIIQSLEKDKSKKIKDGKKIIEDEIDAKKDRIRTEIENIIEAEFGK